MLFLLASWIRLYPKKFFDGAKRWGLIAGACILVSAASIVTGAWVSARIGKTYYYVAVTDCNTLLAACTGLSLFLFFRNLRIKPNRFINAVAATTFGVFCIHACSDTMRQWLWRDTLKNIEYFSRPAGYLHILAAVAAVFTACALIDALRIRLVEKPFFSALDKKLPGWTSRWRKAEDRLANRWNIGDE